MATATKTEPVPTITDKRQVTRPPRRSAKLRAARAAMKFAATLLGGILLGGGVVYLHASGYLAPLYDAIGLHGLAGSGEEHGAVEHGALGEHAGTAAMQAEPSGVPGYTIVTIPPDRQQLIGVRTGRVERDRLVMSIRTVGIVEPDQTRLGRIHARASGWVRRVYVNFVGQAVNENDPLLEIYSPDLATAQREYLNFLESARAMPTSETRQRMVESARRRLENFGIAEAEIQELERSGEPHDTLLLRSPMHGEVLERNVLEGTYVEPATELYQVADLSVVWLQARLYEHEQPHIEVGQRAGVTLPWQPGRVFEGTVSFVEPVLQEMTRSVRVRVELPNAEGLLRPGMYADVEVVHDMGEGLLVPESAVLRTGTRAIALRPLPQGRFEPVEVELGSRFGDRFQVLAGLAEGDAVVTSGNFFIDSESRLRAATGMMGHQH